MKQYFCTILALYLTAAAYAQTAAQQQSTSPAAATDNAVKTNPAPTKTADPSGAAVEPTSGANADQPTMPTVKKFPAADPQEVDPKVAVPPLKNKKVTLIGGIVREIDPIRNHMTVDIFGGKPMKVTFDDRTKVSRNGADISYMNIRTGDRVYLDTQLHERKIFAKQIQIVTKTEAADVSGQVVSFDPKTRQLELRDSLSARPFVFIVDSDAAITGNGGKAGGISDLQPGALVTAHFNPGQSGRGSIRDVNVLAAPGAEFTLFGAVNHLDLRAGRLAVQNKYDDKAYEVRFDPSQFNVDNLRMGSEVSLTARFDGQDYVAQSLNVLSGSSSASASGRAESDEASDADTKDADTKNDSEKSENQKKKKAKEQREIEDEAVQNPK